jgi:hypothetical protein
MYSPPRWRSCSCPAPSRFRFFSPATAFSGRTTWPPRRRRWSRSRGLYLGQRLRARISQATVEKAVLGVLILIGLNLLRRALA